MQRAADMVTRIRRWVHDFGGREPAVLAAVLIALAALWGFIAIADEVSEGDTQKFDVRIVRAMRTADDPTVPIGPSWLPEIARDITSLGGYGCLILFALMIAGYFHLDRKRHLSWLLVGAAVSGYLVSNLLKLFFQRPRPDVVEHLSVVQTLSFPSGHSMNSAVIYLTLGVIAAAGVAKKRLRVYVIGVAMFITLLVGISRVYLGVHYPTDVLAGWMAGTVWALLCWVTARILQQRGKVEQPTEISETSTGDKHPAPLENI